MTERQDVFGSGFAYAAAGADVHVFADRGPVYVLTPHHGPGGGGGGGGRAEAAAFRAQPSSLLGAHHRVVPFTGRQSELVDLTRWRDAAGGRPSVRWLHGPGGQGKSRLAAELADRSAAAGWLVVHALPAGELPLSSERHVDLDATGSAGVLLVVDYADRWPLAHLTWLFANRLFQRGSAVRVLLLARTGYPWPALRAVLRRRGFGSTDERLLAPLPAVPGARAGMFVAARDAFAARYGLTDPASAAPPGPLDHPDLGVTLALHMAALVAVDAATRGVAPPRDPAALSAYLLDRERAHWARLHEGQVEGLEFGTPPTVMARAVFTSVVTGALDHHEAEAVLRRLAPGGEPWRTLRDHALCYPPAGPEAGTVLEPLYPDRLAEDFLALMLPGHSTAFGDPWAASALPLLPAATGSTDVPLPHARRALTFLTAAAARWPHVGPRHLFPLVRATPRLAVDAGGAALAALAELPGCDVEVLRAVEPHLPDGRHQDLDVAALAVTERLARHRVATTDDPERQAHALAVLAWRLANVGAHQRAAETGEEAVRRYRQLVGARPDRHLRYYLAASLTHLGNTRSSLERPEEALAAQEEAVALFRALAGTPTTGAVPPPPDHPAALPVGNGHLEASSRLLATAHPLSFLPALAGAVDNLGTALAALGRADEALDRAVEGTALRRLLVDVMPEEHRADLAMSLHNLGARLLALGRFAEALAATTEAVKARRILGSAEPSAHLPDLAMSLHNLGTALASLDRRDEALATAREAVACFRRAASANPAYAPHLVSSLCSAARLARSTGRWPEALRSAEEAVSIGHPLADASPEVHLPRLAEALTERRRTLSGAGRTEDAARAAADVVAAYRRLDPSGPGLAEALIAYGNTLAEAGRHHDACEATAEAVAHHRRLAAAGPVARREALAEAVDNLALDLAALGRDDEALAASTEAVALYRRLGRTRPGGAHADALAALVNHAELLRVAGRARHAARTADEAVAIGRRLLAADPDQPPTALAKALLCSALSRLDAGTGLRGAAHAAQEARTLFTRCEDAESGRYTAIAESARRAAVSALRERTGG